MNNDAKRDLIGSVTRALTILEVIAAHPRGLTPKAISSALHLNLSTCYYLLNTLVAAGFLQRRHDNQAYVLGAKIAYLHSAFLQTIQVMPVLMDYVQRLRDATGETAYLGQWQHGDVVINAIVEGSQPVRVQSLYVGYRGNAHAMALGKLLLAHLPLHDLQQYLERAPLPACTPHTITDPEQLRTHLSQVRHAGYAIDIEELAPELCCIAAPIIDRQGQVQAALALSVPRSRYDRLAEQFISALKHAAQHASAALGNYNYSQQLLHT